MAVPTPEPFVGIERMSLVNGLETFHVEAGSGAPVVLLHSGEFGSCGRLSWEYNVACLARYFRVLVPDWVGFGRSAKVHDFGDFAGFMIRQMAAWCERFGLRNVPFIGNSMAANFLLRDASEPQPLLHASRIVAISGGGPVPRNEARQALVDYDCSEDGMRRVVAALFHDPKWSQDPAYIARRHSESLIPGAWECCAAARFRSPASPMSAVDALRAADLPVEQIAVPTLLIAGREDKLKPRGYAQEIARRIRKAESVEIRGVGHCAQIEDPASFNRIVLAFLGVNEL